MTDNLSVLRDHLDKHGVEGADPLIARAWPDLNGGIASAMAAHKTARHEGLTWASPILTFRIERHGAASLGSSLAEVQEWTVDLNAGTATAETVGARHIKPRATALDVKALAREIAELVDSGGADDRIVWSGDVVHPILSRIIPDTGPKATVEGRRKRLKAALDRELGLIGLMPIGRGQYSRANAMTALGREPVVDLSGGS